MLARIWQARIQWGQADRLRHPDEEPNELVADYHDWMPLTLAHDKVGTWLDLSIPTR
jgi:putative SOS response-associated peptidase YedK